MEKSCFLLRVAPEHLADYLEAHEAVWPDMLRALHSCGWRNYTLFLEESSGLVVGYFESEDVNQSFAEMEKREVNTLWQREMSKYFLAPDGGKPQILRNYFNLESSLERIGE